MRQLTHYRPARIPGLKAAEMAQTGGPEGPTLARLSRKVADGALAQHRYPSLVRRSQFATDDEIIKRVNDVRERGGTGIIVLSGRS